MSQPLVDVGRESDQRLEERFHELAAAWKADTRHSSSAREMAMHPAYQQIIGLGPRALPLLLRELEREPDHWFWALRAIAGEDPVPPESRGDVPAMTDNWLAWGRQNGCIAPRRF